MCLLWNVRLQVQLNLCEARPNNDPKRSGSFYSGERQRTRREHQPRDEVGARCVLMERQNRIGEGSSVSGGILEIQKQKQIVDV